MAADRLLLESAILCWNAARILLSAFVAGIIGTVLLFDGLGRIAAYVSGFKTFGFDADAEDDFDLDTATDKTKRRKSRIQKAIEERSGGPPKRPRKMYLIVPLILVSFTYLLDGAALVIDALVARHGRVEDIDFWPMLVSLVSYWLCYALLQYSTAMDITDAICIKLVAFVSFCTQPLILAANIAVVYLDSASRHDPLIILFLSINALRLIVFIGFITAYLPHFREERSAKSGPVANVEEAEPLLGEPSATDGSSESDSSSDTQVSDTSNGTDTSPKKDGSEEDEEGDDIEEEVEKKIKERTRSYDLAAIIKRLKRLLPYLAPVQSRATTFLAVICVILTLFGNVCRVLLPRQQGKVVEDLVSHRAPWRDIIIWCLLEAALGWLGILYQLRRALWIPVEQLSERELSIMSCESDTSYRNVHFVLNYKSVRHVLQLSARYHQNKKTGEVLSILDRSDAPSDFLNFFLFEMAPLFIDLGVAVVYITAVYGPLLTGVIAVTGVAYFSVTLLSRTRKIKLQSRVLSRIDSIAGVKNESISNVDLVKYFSAEEYEISRYTKGVLATQIAQLDSSFFSRMTNMAENLVMQAGILLGSLVVSRQILLGTQDVGAFVTFTMYINTLMGHIQNLAWMNNYFTELMTNTDKLIDILDERNDILDKPEAEELYECKGSVIFDNVSFAYPTMGKTKKEPKEALKNISFTVKPGMHVALVGETGSGKSTIFKLLFRFFEVSTGSIKVDGRDIRDYTQRSLRGALGVVQQEGALFNDTIAANIRYGDITANDEQVTAVAKIAKIHDKIMTWPKKYYTVVGERGVKLSGGEKQRVSIARTLLKNPSILLLDEATSALDTNTEKEIQSQLRRLTRGKTTIAIAHRLSTIAHADLILVLKDGAIVESGEHAVLITKEDGHYKTLWDAQIAIGKTVSEDDSSLANNSAIEVKDVDA